LATEGEEGVGGGGRPLPSMEEKGMRRRGGVDRVENGEEELVEWRGMGKRVGPLVSEFCVCYVTGLIY